MDNYCIGCGLCEAMCHRQAITVGENKKGSCRTIDRILCDHCGVCDKVCPIDQMKVKETLNIPLNVAIGRSKDGEVVRCSASGGIVSEILMYLFQKNEIEAAIVAFYDVHANIYGDVIEKEEDVLKHSGSYYHTSKQLINVQKIRKYNRVAVVGLPCHIEGVINYCNFTKQMDKVIKIALFCTIGRTYEGFRRFFKRETGFDIAEGNVKKYVSRYGKKKLIHIEDDKGNVYECQDELYKFRMDFFYANKACLNCRKLYGLSADISVGDAWHRVKEENGVREKVAITSANTSYGEDIIATLRGKLQLEYVDNGASELVRSQKYGASLKQLHKNSVIRGLNRVRIFRNFIGIDLLFWIFNRIRGEMLNQLENDTKTLKLDNKEK